jgi:nucleoside-diphosphate-sugar epimerase
MTNLIFGCGYVGTRVADRWLQESKEVRVLTRSAVRANEFSARGIQPAVGELLQPDSWPSDLFQDVDTILFSVGFDHSRSDTIEQVYVAGLRNVLSRCPNSVQRVIYISSTGVYGPCSGEIVDEETPCRPQRPGGKASLAAEVLLRLSPFSERSVVLRLAGIYGPDRVPRMKDVRDKKPITAHAEGFLNLVHVEDAAAVVAAVSQSQPQSTTYNVSDGHPVPRREFYREIARLLDAPEPIFVEPTAEELQQTRGSDKRVSSEKIRTEVDLKWQYPSYREGLAAIVNTSR